ncbi:unnamed protein product [Thelazia callipaeda]|uniref:DRY_EERY domain-containing protein n=1 Tax=Thelazia callipaeda TaxID=103827 RepID=A0A0N5CX31_THECL|nr:unnamed protein product [Thelazia callipaeda]
MLSDVDFWLIYYQRYERFWKYQSAAVRWLEVHQVARNRVSIKPSGVSVNSVDVDGSSSNECSKVQGKECLGTIPIPWNFQASFHSYVSGRHTVWIGNRGLKMIDSNSGSVWDVEQTVPLSNADEDIGMSEEMASFFRKTIEHRKQRDADRNMETRKRNGDWLDTEEYVMADKIGIYGYGWRSLNQPDGPAEKQKKLHTMRKLYGSNAEKISAMEAHLDLRFEQNYSQSGALLWPNIPLKF